MFWFRRILLFALLVAGASGAVYVQSETFSKKWCTFVVEQFEQRDVFISVDRLSLDPIDGVVAKGIRLFQDRERQVLLVEMDRLNLDLDYGMMVQNKVFLEGIDLRDADVTLPLDPQNPHSEKLKVTDLNARLLLTGDLLDIRKAEGVLFGLHFSITGSLLKPRESGGREDEAAAKERRRRQLEALHARRNLVVEAARILKHFESAHAPRLDVVVNGDLEHPEELNATLRLNAKGLKHGTYVCEEMDALATYSGETVDLVRFRVKDHLGELETSATWELGGEHVDFHLRSSADLPGLASAILQKEVMREVVFYEPVELVADGQFLLGKAIPEDAVLPLKCVGSVNAGRFVTRGEVMDGLSVNFGLSPEGWYFRDGLLRHKTGTLSAQTMWKKGEGFKYRAVIKMDPNVFLPFVQVPQAQEIIQFFQFREESSIYGEVEGEGPEPNIAKCQNFGRAEVKDFKYRGVEVPHITSDVEFHGPVHIYRNVKIWGPDNTSATAKEVYCDESKRSAKLTGAVSTVNPADLVSCFAPPIGRIIAAYRFDKHPYAEADGVISIHPNLNNLKVKFRSQGTAHYQLWEDDYTVQKPAGDLTFKGSQLTYAITGGLFGKDMSCKGLVNLQPGVQNYTADFRAGSFPYPVFGEMLPFKQLHADIVGKNGTTTFDISSNAFGGNFTMSGVVDDRVKTRPYKGELRFNAIVFKQFAQVYSPENDTEGDITGHFNFTGKLGDWKTLQGTGALTILNGNLYAVPILGPLTPLLGGLLPRPMAGYNVAKEADCTFKVADGFFTTDNFEALTGVFRLVVKGSVDFMEDRVQLEAQARFRGLPGLVLFAVSEILEYVGEGSIGDPVWRPRYFSATKEKNAFRKADPAEAVGAAVPPPNVPRKSAPERKTRAR